MSETTQGEGGTVAGLPTEFLFDQSPVRALMKEGEPWFVAKDVCDILGIDNPSQAVGRLDDDESGIATIDTTAGPRELLTVNESGVYSLAFPQMGDKRGPTRNPQDRRLPSSGDGVRRPLGRAGRIRALASRAGAPRR